VSHQHPTQNKKFLKDWGFDLMVKHLLTMQEALGFDP
jgi:hypothetical protein